MYLLSLMRAITSMTISSWVSAKPKRVIKIASSRLRKYLERQKVRAYPSTTQNTYQKKSQQVTCFRITKYACSRIPTSMITQDKSVFFSLTSLIRTTFMSVLLNFPQTVRLADSNIRMNLLQAFESMEKIVLMSLELTWSMKITVNWSETKIRILLT